MKAKLVKESLNETMGAPSLFVQMYMDVYGENPGFDEYTLGDSLDDLEETEGLDEVILSIPGVNGSFGTWDYNAEQDLSGGDEWEDFESNLYRQLNLVPQSNAPQTSYLYTEYDERAKTGWYLADEYTKDRRWFFEI